jgi:hypothetical protein
MLIENNSKSNHQITSQTSNLENPWKKSQAAIWSANYSWLIDKEASTIILPICSQEHRKSVLILLTFEHQLISRSMSIIVNHSHHYWIHRHTHAATASITIHYHQFLDFSFAIISHHSRRVKTISFSRGSPRRICSRHGTQKNGSWR